MKIERTITETRTTSDTTCDRCGKPSGYSDREVTTELGHSTDRAAIKLAVRQRVIVSREKSEHHEYGEGGESAAVEYDVCAACFEEVVRPAIEALGFKPRITETNW